MSICKCLQRRLIRTFHTDLLRLFLLTLQGAPAKASERLQRITALCCTLAPLTCSMVFSVPALLNSTEEANRANAYPDIRILTVGQGTQSTAPLMNLNLVEVRL